MKIQQIIVIKTDVLDIFPIRLSRRKQGFDSPWTTNYDRAYPFAEPCFHAGVPVCVLFFQEPESDRQIMVNFRIGEYAGNSCRDDPIAA